jgi:hypothetical protein
MSLPENYGDIEYDGEGNIVAYEGIPIAQYQIPYLYRSLPPHKRKVVQSIFYCYALDEMDELLYADVSPMDEFNELAYAVIEKARHLSVTPPPENTPKKRRYKKS